MTVTGRLTALLGEAAVDTGADIPVARPWSLETAAAVVRVAHEAGWRVRIQGASRWMPPDAPADVALSTASLARVVDLAPDDLVVTAEGGLSCAELDRALAERGVWLPLDPPGGLERTIGSVVATGTWGPLRLGFGPIRDQILGLTAVTGEGRTVRAGGRVVKNVAGYDLSRVIAGSFGAFGLIVGLHLRLRTRPRADATWTAAGARDDLFEAVGNLAATNCRPVALELLSPGATGSANWSLIARLAGSPTAVEADASLLRGVIPGAHSLPGDAATAVWGATRLGASSGPVTVRAGGLPEAVELVVEDVEHALGPGWIAAGPLHGGVRWSGSTDAAALHLLRRRLAAREVPLTLERASWPLRSGCGHFGAYREGSERLTRELRRAFDPGGRFVAPLEAR